MSERIGGEEPESTDSVHGHPFCSDCEHETPTGSGCRVVEPGSELPLDAFLARHRCFITDRVQTFARAVLRHRPQSGLRVEDVVQDVALRLIQDPERRRGGLATNLSSLLAYLHTTTTRCVIDAARKTVGRVRCGNCRHHGSWIQRCLAPHEAWTGRDIAPGTDPRRLTPPCTAFSSRKAQPSRDAEALSHHLTTEVEPHDDAIEGRRVRAALVGLAQADPRAALVVRARLLEGRSYESLVRPGASLRTLKRAYARGLAWLRERLGADEGP